MKCSVKKLKDASCELSIELSKETVEEVFERVFHEISKEAKVPGFRPGKVPMDIIRQNYQADAMDEVKRRLIPEAYQEALEEHSIQPLSYPEVGDINLSLTGKLTFKAKVDTHPKVNVRKYKGLKVTTEKIKVDDEEVTETLSRLQNMNAEFVDIDTPLKKGDFAICDVETSMEGKIISKKRENMWIEINKDASMLGMGEDLCGMEKADKKDIEAELPEKYPDEKYAGKKAVFHIEVKETKEKKLPELNDEFAKKIGKDTIKEAREEIKNELLSKKEVNVKIDMKNQIMKQLIDGDKMELPGSMVSRQLKVLMERAENELKQKGVSEKDIGDHREKLKAQLTEEAENKVKIYFLLDKIAGNEGITVSDEDVDGWIKNLAGTYNKPFDEVKKYHVEHNLIGGLIEQLREEKTLDFILSKAVISEK